MKIILLKILILSILSVSCSKKVRLFKEDLYRYATAKDERLEFVLGSTYEGKLSTCENYIGDCINVFGVKLGMIYFQAVEFQTEEGAQNAAKKYRGYFYRNWFFDDVSGEPALEELMVKLEAKKP